MMSVGEYMTLKKILFGIGTHAARHDHRRLRGMASPTSSY